MDPGRDRAGWPLAEATRDVEVAPHRWSVAVTGTGPVLLFLHGTGGAGMSWRDVVERLSGPFTCVVPDLPGHGFTRAGTRTRSGLRPMAEDLARLLAAEGWQPAGIVGHSAGAALALEMTRHLEVPAVVGVNAALAPFPGAAGWLFPAMAKALALNPFVPGIFAATGGRRAAALIAGTGSRISEEGLGYYARLFRDRAHVDGALAMMAGWDVTGLRARLGEIGVPALLLAGEDDRTVPASVSEAAAARMPRAEVRRMPGGHLLHEEDPGAVAGAIRGFLEAHGAAGP